MKTSVLAGIFATGVAAQGGPWAQCGGNNFSGPTTCVSGYTCVYQNDWYSQCLPGAAPTTATTAKTSTTTKATSTSTKATSTTLKTSTVSSTTTSSAPAASSSAATKGKLKWFGINQSCAEFGQGSYPGTWGKHFTFPSTSSIQVRIE